MRFLLEICKRKQAMSSEMIVDRGAVLRDPRALALLFAASLTTMANATISPALGGLSELFADHPNARFVTTLLVPAPSLTFIFCAPLAGLAADRLGRRWLLLIGILLFAITGSAGLYLPDLTSILMSRLALGLAVAMIMTSQTALLGDYYEGTALKRLAGLQVSARNFGGFTFITLAGWLAATSPRLPFAVYALPVLLLLLVCRAIAEPAIRRDRAAAPCQSLVSLGEKWLGPMMGLAALQMGTTALFFIMPTQVPFLLEARGYDSASGTGMVLGALTLAGGLAALAYHRASGRFGEVGVFAIGYVLMALGFAGIASRPEFAATLAGAVAIGLGFALVMPNFVALALTIAPAQCRGVVGGILTTSVFVGQVVSPFATTPMIDKVGYAWTYAAAAGLVLCLAMASSVAALLRR
ncbi:MFS transporter [Chelativorans xinjiangense]|uniref:MFS transporter n=1 Tax=Chelativorans xinjiangense TaxID=2681485 RepID=UPI001FE9B61B|nr:MFS transporter [Chelativorans xinjiangense]